MFQTQIIKKQLHFKQPAGTSRGVYTTRNVWYILLTDTDNRYYGVGECAPLPALSCDDVPNYDELLAIACKNFEKTGEIDREALLPYPSILFGLETALLHFRACSLQFWHIYSLLKKRVIMSILITGIAGLTTSVLLAYGTQ